MPINNINFICVSPLIWLIFTQFPLVRFLCWVLNVNISAWLSFPNNNIFIFIPDWIFVANTFWTRSLPEIYGPLPRFNSLSCKPYNLILRFCHFLWSKIFRPFSSFFFFSHNSHILVFITKRKINTKSHWIFFPYIVQ